MMLSFAGNWFCLEHFLQRRTFWLFLNLNIQNFSTERAGFLYCPFHQNFFLCPFKLFWPLFYFCLFSFGYWCMKRLKRAIYIIRRWRWALLIKTKQIWRMSSCMKCSTLAHMQWIFLLFDQEKKCVYMPPGFYCLPCLSKLLSNKVSFISLSWNKTNFIDSCMYNWDMMLLLLLFWDCGVSLIRSSSTHFSSKNVGVKSTMSKGSFILFPLFLTDELNSWWHPKKPAYFTCEPFRGVGEDSPLFIFNRKTLPLEMIRVLILFQTWPALSWYVCLQDRPILRQKATTRCFSIAGIYPRASSKVGAHGRLSEQ